MWIGNAQVQNSAPACTVKLLLAVSSHQRPWVDLVLHWICGAETKSAIRNYSLWERRGAGPGCPEKLWLPPPWQCSRPGWTGLWAPCSGRRGPCPWQGGGTGWALRFLPTQTIRWFYEERHWGAGLHQNYTNLEHSRHSLNLSSPV